MFLRKVLLPFSGYINRSKLVRVLTRTQAVRLKTRCSIPGRLKNYAAIQSVQSGSGAHLVFCLFGTGRYFSRGKAVES